MLSNEYRIQFNIKKSLKNLQTDFFEIFEADLIEYDFENQYEWIEVYSKKFNLYANISRDHHGNPGSSKESIVISLTLHYYKKDELEDYKNIASLISKHLDISVSFGKIEIIPNKGEYKFVVLGNYFVKKEKNIYHIQLL